MGKWLTIREMAAPGGSKKTTKMAEFRKEPSRKIGRFTGVHAGHWRQSLPAAAGIFHETVQSMKSSYEPWGLTPS
jgi:hypothetical protein